MAAIFNRAALAPAVLVLAATAFAGCTTYGTGVNTGTQTLTDIGGLVDLSGGKKPAIDYKPRPPLAAPPPGSAPPAPAAPSAVATAADWPNDPDAAARAAKAARRQTYDYKSDALYDPGIHVPVQKENHTYMTKRGTGYEDAVASANDTDKQKELTTKKLMGEAKNSVSYDANGNPIRKTLVDPPVVYREPDPSAPTVFNTKKKFHWPWQKAQQDDALASEEDASPNLNKHAPAVQ
jgi:type IV secretory pathway VirB10-like protein